MNLEERLSNHLSQEAEGHQLPPLTPIDTITGTARQRSRRRNAAGGLLASLALAGAAFFGGQAFIGDDEGTVTVTNERESGIDVPQEDDVLPSNPPTIEGDSTVQLSSPQRILATDDGYVAFNFSPAGDTTVATSADGETWTALPAANLPPMIVLDATYHEGQLIVAGFGSDALNSLGEAPSPIAQPPGVAMTSTDLVNWTELELPQPNSPEGTIATRSVLHLAAGDPGILLVTQLDLEPDYSFYGLDPETVCGWSSAYDRTGNLESTAARIELCDGTVIDIDLFAPVMSVPAPQLFFVGEGREAVAVPMPFGPGSWVSGAEWTGTSFAVTGFDPAFNGPQQAARIAFSADGTNFSTPSPLEATNSDPAEGVFSYNGDLVTSNGVLAMHAGATLVLSPDNGATWTEIDVAGAVGTTAELQVIELIGGEAGFVATAFEGGTLAEPVPLGGDGRTLNVDGYRIEIDYRTTVVRTPEGETATFEPGDPSALTERMVDESTGIVVDLGGIYVIDPVTNEERVLVPAAQIAWSFHSTSFGTEDTSYSIGSGAYSLQIEPGMNPTVHGPEGMLFEFEEAALWNADPTDGIELIVDDFGPYVVIYDEQGGELARLSLNAIASFQSGESPPATEGFTVEADGYVLELFPDESAQLRTVDGVTIYDWAPVEGDGVPEGVIVEADGSISVLDPNNADEVLVNFPVELMVSSAGTASPESLEGGIPSFYVLFSSDGLNWEILTTSSFGGPNQVAVGEDEVLVFNGLSPAIERFPVG